MVAKRTILQSKAVTVVPVQRLAGTWLLEPVPKWARTQAVPAVYKDIKRIATINLTETAVTWMAGLIVATIAPMDPDRDSNQERVMALRMIRHARGQSLSNQSLDQLYYTLELEDNRLLRSNPFFGTAVYDLIREFQDIFTSLECEAEVFDLLEFPLEGDRREQQKGPQARVVPPR